MSEREFEQLAKHVSQSWLGCGEDHARLVAVDLAGLSHDATRIMSRAAEIVAECLAAARQRGFI